MRKALILVAISAVVGCGGDSTGPSNDYPNVAGTYAVSGTFDDLPGDAISGTVTLVQADRTTGTFGGSVNLFVTGVDQPVSGSLPSTSTVSKSGQVTFVLAEGSTSWVFTGTLSGNTITGRQTLSGSGSTFSGPWSATRP